MIERGIALLARGPGRDAMKRRCREAGVSIKVLEALVEAEIDQIGKLRKRGLFEAFDEILSQYTDSELQEGVDVPSVNTAP